MSNYEPNDAGHEELDHAPGCVDDSAACDICGGTDPEVLDIDGIPLDSLGDPGADDLADLLADTD